MKKSLVFAAMLVPALALAQPKSADDWYKEGETQYNLGNFDKAAEAFKEGFSVETDESKQPAYLYNVAQAYRQGNRCRDASFFYKRYLALKDRDTVKPLKPDKRAEIEQRIAELDECARTQESIANKPPGDTIRPDGADGKTGAKTGTGTKTGAGTTGTGTGTATGTTVGDASEDGDVESEEDSGDEDGGSVTSGVLVTPRVINVRVVGGITKVMMADLPTGVKPAFSLTAGYPVFAQDKLGIDVGASLGFSPMPYTDSTSSTSHTASLTTVLANGAVTYTIVPKLAGRADVGVGVLLFSGLQMGNPFTEGGASASGALSMLAVRAAASLDYAITPNIVATLTPIAFGYSPAKEGLRSDIGSILRLDVMAGVGYRM